MEERNTLEAQLSALKEQEVSLSLMISDYKYLDYDYKEKKKVIDQIVLGLKKDKLEAEERKLFRCFKWQKFWKGDVTNKCKINLEKAPKASHLILTYYDFYQLPKEELVKRKQAKKKWEDKKSKLLIDMNPIQNRMQFLDKKLEVEKRNREKINQIVQDARAKKLDCNPNTYIDLDETTLKEFRPTSQGSTNTCYAHALSAVLGSHLESFVNPYDLAVHYKASNHSQDRSFTLGWGNACQAFEAIKEIGVCVDSHEEMNAGHTHQLSELLSGFYSSLLETKESEFDKIFLKRNARSIIQSLKNDINLKLPFPVNTYAFNVNQLVSYAGLSEEEEVKVGEEMWKVYDQYRLKFYKDVLGNKTGHEVAEGFYQHHKKYFDLYPGISNKKDEIFKQIIDNVNSYRNSDKKRNEIASSLNFYFTQLGFHSAEEFSCIDKSINVLSSVTKFIDFNHEINTIVNEILENDQLSQADLYSSFLTPNCINKMNRLPVSDLECRGVEFKQMGSVKLSQEQQKVIFQSSVLEELKKGRALFYSIPRHAMSIVGIRYDKSKQMCEYKIRDSATGSSSWKPEVQVIDDASFLGTIN